MMLIPDCPYFAVSLGWRCDEAAQRSVGCSDRYRHQTSAPALDQKLAVLAAGIFFNKYVHRSPRDLGPWRVLRGCKGLAKARARERRGRFNGSMQHRLL